MMEVFKPIFHSDVGSVLNNWALLAFRVLLALELFRVHGLRKLRGNKGRPEDVPNPLHLPKTINQVIATFSDTVVPFLVMIGIGTRLFVLPVIGVTAIGYFVVHRKDSIEVRDVPYIYTICFLLLLVLGAGSISIDQVIYHLLY